MARLLKMFLDDGNSYSFSTLTLRQQKAIRNKFKAEENNKEVDALLLRIDSEKPLTEEEQKQLDDYQDARQNQLLDIIRMSLAKNHEEFKISDNKTEEMINSDLEDLLDMPSLQKASSFAMSGTLTREIEEEYAVIDIIDLTTEGSNVK